MGRERVRIGEGTSVITPFLEQRLAGYYYPRCAEGVHDHLFAKALVFDDGRNEIVWVACDTIHVTRGAAEEARRRIHAQTGIAPEQILISAIHSHTGPEITPDYSLTLGHRIADAVITAHRRKRPASLFIATEQEPTLPHYRRYRMKDGSVVTNPGFLNPDVIGPLGEIDPRVAVLYAEDDRGAPLMTWVNYAMHLDTVGGAWISADYACFLARALAELKGPGMLTLFTIGAAGNINHWDVGRPGPQRGFAEARRLGETLAAAVARAYSHLAPLEPCGIQALSHRVRIPLQAIASQDVERAEELLAQPPEPDVDFTLDRVIATRVKEIARREQQDLEAEIQVMSLGSRDTAVSIAAIPGEMFVELGKAVQAASPFAHTFIVELANDNIGYIPTKAAFREGAYEPSSAVIADGGGEQIAAAAIAALAELKETERHV